MLKVRNKMQYLRCNILLLAVLCLIPQALSWDRIKKFDEAEAETETETYQGSSDSEDLEYHMGPILASPINLYIIWYGNWKSSHQDVIRDFIQSISSPAASPYPSVADWWRTVRLYTDQTGSNITGKIVFSGEFYDLGYSHGSNLNRITMQYIIKNAVSSHPRALPLDPRNGLYLVLTSSDVKVEEFCRAICGFHYFTFPTIVGVTVPFSWIGYSGTQCPGMCGYPSGRPTPGNKIMLPPNGDAGVDGMISVIGHELAEVSSDPLVNAWYAGEDPSAPTEIADMCQGVYGSGAGGGYVGVVYKDTRGKGYNVNGIKGRKFMVQWIWHPEKRRCFGPNAIID